MPHTAYSASSLVTGTAHLPKWAVKFVHCMTPLCIVSACTTSARRASAVMSRLTPGIVGHRAPPTHSLAMQQSQYDAMQGQAHAGLHVCHAHWAQPIFRKESWKWHFCRELTWKANESDAAAASAEEGQVCGAHLQAAAQDARDDGGVRDHRHGLSAVLVRGRLQHAPRPPAALPEHIHRLCSPARVCCHLRTDIAPLGACCRIRLAHAKAALLCLLREWSCASEESAHP